MPKPVEEDAECDLDGRGKPYDCGRRFASGDRIGPADMLVYGEYEYEDTCGNAIGVGCDDHSVWGGYGESITGL